MKKKDLSKHINVPVKTSQTTPQHKSLLCYDQNNHHFSNKWLNMLLLVELRSHEEAIVTQSIWQGSTDGIVNYLIELTPHYTLKVRETYLFSAYAPKVIVQMNQTKGI